MVVAVVATVERELQFHEQASMEAASEVRRLRSRLESAEAEVCLPATPSLPNDALKVGTASQAADIARVYWNESLQKDEVLNRYQVTRYFLASSSIKLFVSSSCNGRFLRCTIHGSLASSFEFVGRRAE